MAKSVPKIILSRIIGFLIFLILLAIANILIPAVDSKIYSSIINFFNTNLILLFILTIIGMINEVFWSFYFPFSIIAPITGAILSIYIIIFIHKLFDFLNIYIQPSIALPWQTIHFIVFWIVLIAGYLIILIRQGKPREDWHEEIKKWHEQKWERKKIKLQRKMKKIDRKLGKKKFEWEDVGNEFKTLFYNIGNSLNNLFEGKKKKIK
jgi:hypothetical protein